METRMASRPFPGNPYFTVYQKLVDNSANGIDVVWQLNWICLVQVNA
jgi:hypothetical protein